jgi:hypothetical protein
VPIEKFSLSQFASSVPLTVRHTKSSVKFDTGVTIGSLYDQAAADGQPVLDLEFVLTEIDENSETTGDYVPAMGIFSAFERMGGVQEILTVTQKSLNHWHNETERDKWKLWIAEVDSFSNLPYFFSLFIKNEDCKHLLFQLLAGTPDEQPDTIDDKVAVKYSYEILADMFKMSTDANLRELAYSSGLITRILERLKDI